MIITGSTNNSRLSELRKYTTSTNFVDQYVSGGNWTTDGVDYPNSVSGVTVIYYIGEIKFVDNISTIITTFSCIAQGTGSTENFIDELYIKNPNKSKIISNPKINNDVFITRDDLSALDKNYRLEYIRNLVDLTTYAGGRYFNIINNT